jgi:GT2 family glycosyltransferase
MNAKVPIDIIILSYAKTDLLKGLTIKTIKSVLESENPACIQFNILVIESNKKLKPYIFEHAATIYPRSKFGFHKYLNLGISLTSSPYLCLCNNDLIFHQNWASEIVSAMKKDPSLLSASPYCPDYHNEQGLAQGGPPLEGYFNVITGWCIFLRRELFAMIGLLDENLTFWYSDADYCQTLIENRIKHYLIPTSIVTHLGSESFKTLTPLDKRKLTAGPKLYYDYKWKHGSWLRFLTQKLLFNIKMLVKQDD